MDGWMEDLFGGEFGFVYCGLKKKKSWTNTVNITWRSIANVFEVLK